MIILDNNKVINVNFYRIILIILSFLLFITEIYKIIFNKDSFNEFSNISKISGISKVLDFISKNRDYLLLILETCLLSSLQITLFIDFESLSYFSLEIIKLVTFSIIVSLLHLSNVKSFTIGLILVISDILTEVIFYQTPNIKSLFCNEILNDNNEILLRIVVYIIVNSLIILIVTIRLFENCLKIIYNRLLFIPLILTNILAINLFVINMTFLIFMNENYMKLLINNIINHQFIKVIILWLLLLIITIPTIEIIDRILKLKPIVKRKLFHFLAVIIYSIGISLMNNSILVLISVIILGLFLILEIIRKLDYRNYYINELFKNVTFYLVKNIDKRDDPEFILTHTFLLYGFFHSLLFNMLFNTNIDSYIGLIVLGIGDSMASIIGSHFGKIKTFENKTLEGSIAAIISSLIFTYFINSEINIQTLIFYIFIYFYEGFTLQIDNIFLPVMAFEFRLLLNYLS